MTLHFDEPAEISPDVALQQYGLYQRKNLNSLWKLGLRRIKNTVVKVNPIGLKRQFKLVIPAF